MKKKLGFFSIVVLIGALAFLNTGKIEQNEIVLSNIAALSSAQAEDWDDHYCMLISTDLCYINTGTYPFPPTVIYGLHRY